MGTRKAIRDIFTSYTSILLASPKILELKEQLKEKINNGNINLLNFLESIAFIGISFIFQTAAMLNIFDITTVGSNIHYIIFDKDGVMKRGSFNEEKVEIDEKKEDYRLNIKKLTRDTTTIDTIGNYLPFDHPSDILEESYTNDLIEPSCSKSINCSGSGLRLDGHLDGFGIDTCLRCGRRFIGEMCPNCGWSRFSNIG